MNGFICPFCGTEGSIKDNDRFSSLLCGCRIIIFYYEACKDVVIKKEDYIEYKRKQYEKKNV